MNEETKEVIIMEKPKPLEMIFGGIRLTLPNWDAKKEWETLCKIMTIYFEPQSNESHQMGESYRKEVRESALKIDHPNGNNESYPPPPTNKTNQTNKEVKK